MERQQGKNEGYFEAIPLSGNKIQSYEKWPCSIQGIDENGEIWGILTWHRHLTLEQLLEKRRHMKEPPGKIFRHLETLTRDTNHLDIRFRIETVHDEILSLLPQEPTTHLVPEPIEPELEKTPRRRAAITSKKERSSRAQGKKVG